MLGPAAKLAYSAGVTPLEVAFWRATLGFGFFLLHCLVFRQCRVAGRDLPAFAAFGLVGVAMMFGTNLTAVKEGGAAMASILLYTAPAWVALLSRIFLHEPLTRGKLLALVLSMGGAACVSLGSGGPGVGAVGFSAVFFGLAAGLAYSSHYLFGKLYLSRYSSATLYLYAMPVGALLLLPWVRFHSSPGLAGWGAFLFIGLFSTYGAYMCYLEGLRRLSATRVAVLANMEPVTAAVAAWLWWGEAFSPLGYFGAMLVLSGVVLIIFEGLRPWRVFLGCAQGQSWPPPR